MSNCFEKVKGYVIELGYEINVEDAQEELVVITDESRGLNRLVIDCEYPILVIEQFIFELKNPDDASMLLKLLKMNRNLVHGAFVVDESGKKVLFRDTLQLENLDLNELEASINSLILALTEFADDLISFVRI